MSSQNRPLVAADQKCNYCGGSGRWTKDILAGRPQENVYCPHCHGSGKAGQTIMSEPMTTDAQSQDE